MHTRNHVWLTTHSLCLTLLLAAAGAESFRVHALFPITISEDDPREQTVTVGINDSIAFFLPDERVYCEGIEVHMQIPDAVAQWRDSVACSLYDNITPRPDAAKIDYEGTRIFVEPLPMRPSWTFRIPLSENNTIKDSPYVQKIGVVPNSGNGQFVFVRLQPAMKGVPNETFDALIKVTAKPLLRNKGRLALTVTAPEARAYTIMIDGQQHAAPETVGTVLDTGVHTVSITSEHYRNETRTVRIDQAKTTALEIMLKSIEPTLIAVAPDYVSIFLDDEPLVQRGSEIVVSEGDHVIRFYTDTYELTRKIHIQKGRTYTATLSVDITVTED
ncbi:MAG: hypothetical protein IJ191_09800 [Treponema sp.]|nr:hypothetical protein [Treponema sp.]